MGTRVRVSIVLLALVACACSASARVIGAQAPAPQPSVTMDVVYGDRDGLTFILDVHRPARPNGAGHVYREPRVAIDYTGCVRRACVPTASSGSPTDRTVWQLSIVPRVERLRDSPREID